MAAYRALRERYSFTELCLTPELALEVTLQPVRAFDVDAAILFSDILFPLNVLGITPCFEAKNGFHLTGPLWTELHRPTDLAAALQERICGVYTAVSMAVSNLDRPLIGFSGAPWTLAAFLIEGGSSRDFTSARAALGSPQLKTLMRTLEELVIEHLRLQIQAGCHAIQIFDSRVDLLPDSALEEYSFEPFRRIASRVPPCPILFYKAQASRYPRVPGIALSFDSSVDISTVRTSLPPPTAIQGNLDPRCLLGPRDELATRVRRICNAMRGDTGFIFNVSHGILPETNEEAVRCLVETIRESGP
jgi:uroporphyrinogen decarboxylase